MKNRFFTIILALILSNPSNSSQAQVVTQWPEEIMGYFQQAVPNAISNLGAQGFNGLFTAIGDVSLFSWNQGPHSIGLSTRRDIWDNHDIFNTWTVVDQMTIKYAANAIGPSATMGAALPGIGLTFGGGATLHYLNIRRSDSKHYPTISPIDVRENETKNLLRNPEVKHWYDLDPLHRAQFYETGKRLEIPLRIPLTHRGLNRLDSGEIISYDVMGTISLGGNVGWTIPSLSDIPSLSLGLTLTTYLTGGYRYTIQKISPEKSRIKVTRSRAWGVTETYGAAFNPIPFYQGFTVLSFNNIGAQTFNITPFQFQATHEFATMFDVAYEYDLTQESGQAAYDRAMLGDLAYSENQIDEWGEKANPPVKKAFTQKVKQEKINKAGQVTLGFLYRKQDNRNITRIDSQITMPDGTHHLFRAVSDNWKQWQTLTGQDEKIRYQFSFFSNLERYEKNLDDSLSLLAEGFMDDATSSGFEMRRYSNRFEALAGVKKEVFPRLPLYPPSLKDTACEGWKGWKSFSCIVRKLRPKIIPAYYGRSSFYVKLGFNRPMLEKFMNTPKEKMWPILETAFGVGAGDWSNPASRAGYFFEFLGNRMLNAPSYLWHKHYDRGPNLDIAKRFHKQWVDLAEEKDVKEKIKMLSKIFSSVYYGEELIKVLRLSLQDTPVPYTISAQNKLFSHQIRDENWGITVTDYLSDLSQREIDVENYHSTVNLDEKAKVTDLKVGVMKAEDRGEKQTPGIKLNTSFNLSVKPKFIFFKLMTRNRWSFTRNVSEAMMANANRFKVGANQIMIENEAAQDLGNDLFKSLIVGKKYMLVVSVSQDGKTWGPIAETEFTPGIEGKVKAKLDHIQKPIPVVTPTPPPTNDDEDEVLLESDEQLDQEDDAE